MTDIRRTNEARVHQPRGGGDSFRSSCNSTPEPHNLHTTFTTSAERNTTNGHTPLLATLTNGHHQSGYRKPLLQSLADHVNMSSTSGGSSSSSTATATTAQRCNGYNGGGAGAGGSEIQFDEREIYYVSPSKRKTANSSSYCAPTSGSLRLKCNASIAPSYPPITPSAAYGARTGAATHDFSFDSFDTASHYSDTAMQLLRSGSGSAAATTGIINSLASMRDCSSSSSSLTTMQQPTRQTTNVVTFSSPLGEERPVLPIQQQQQHNNRGSLRRSKGRSNQSLCSCDAGADTEINPDPTRPLYQYSLERKHKGHTYTCEQNAQILMRLERERNRRLSLQGGGSKDDVQSDTPSSSDVDVIPPVPPPPVIKRNGSMRSLRHYPHTTSSITSTLHHQSQKQQQQQQQQQLQRPYTTSNQSNNNTIIATLCNSDGGSGSGSGSNFLNDCANNVLEVGSLIDDCTTSILKCANAMGTELMAVTTNSSSSSGNAGSTTHKATLATMASSAKPDVCHVALPYSQQQQQQQQHCIRDDIFAPSSKKSDPSLCFLHLPAAATAADAKIAMPRSILSASGKYNTIGPSSDYARQLAAYSLAQQQQQQQELQSAAAAASHCRCLSQSLSNFSRDYFGHSGHKGPNRDVQHIFYTDHNDWLKEPPPPPPPPPQLTGPHISRSYGNLMDIIGEDFSSSQLPYQKFHTPAVHVSSCSFGSGGGGGGSAGGKLFSNSFTASLTSASSGLKEKLLQQHTHLHHGHQHGHHHSHHQQQQQQQQLATPVAQQHKQQQQMQHLHSSVTSIMPWKHRQCPSRGSSSSGTNSFRFDAAKHWLAVSSILLIIGAASVAVPLALRVAASAPFEERLRVAVQLLDQVPLIDGHNDLPWNIRKFLHNKLNDFNFDEDLRNVMPWARSPWSHTDLQRLKKGRISAQFWAAYVPCEAQHRDAVQLTLEQIDVIKRLTDRYAPQLITCTSAEDIIEAHKNHQLCSLTGVEGGHSLGGSLAVLRTLYAIGVRYMTLTSTCHTPWADSSNADAPTFNVKHGGLTIFGKTIIREMNRLGMMVDLSKVSTGTMRDALEVSEAPVIFSHSSAYELCNSSRNVQDDMLQSLAKNGGLVMVNFYSKFLSCSENSTVHDAVAHINHIKRIAGIDHVGLGAGFDGINFTPKGLEDVSSYPTLFAELLGVGWSIEDLTKLAGGNFLRVMQHVEKVRDEKKAAGVKPYEDHPNFRTDDPYNCTSS